MNAVQFEEANTILNAPEDSVDVLSIPAWVGQIKFGPFDGVTAMVVAKQPTPEEIDAIKNGAKIYLTFLGSCPPHMATTEFPYKLE